MIWPHLAAYVSELRLNLFWCQLLKLRPLLLAEGDIELGSWATSDSEEVPARAMHCDVGSAAVALCTAAGPTAGRILPVHSFGSLFGRAVDGVQCPRRLAITLKLPLIFASMGRNTVELMTLARRPGHAGM